MEDTVEDRLGPVGIGLLPLPLAGKVLVAPTAAAAPPAAAVASTAPPAVTSAATAWLKRTVHRSNPLLLAF